MTDTEINMTIAQACGWEWRPNPKVQHPSRNSWWIPPHMKEFEGCADPKSFCPDYCTDLNAMHEAEKTLTEYELQGKYPRELASLVVNCGWLPESSTSILRLVHSTARQRAEAFLRTIGKWKEPTP